MKEILDRLGLTAILVWWYGYIRFGAYFAERRIELGFLPFPIFMGELLMAICMLIYLIRMKYVAFKITNGFILCSSFIMFVLIKAWFGYVNYGVLALRHSALFYYVLFIGFGHEFFDRKYVTKTVYVMFALLMLHLFLCKVGRCYTDRWVYTFFAGCILMAREYWLSGILLIIFPFKSLFVSARAILVGTTSSGIFLLTTFRSKMKILIVAYMVLFVAIGVLMYGNKREYESILNVEKIVKEYITTDIVIESKKAEYKQEEITNIRYFMDETEQRKAYARVYWVERVAASGEKIRVKSLEPTKAATSANNRFGNIMFRLFVWRDMLRDIMNSRSVTGFSFGKPFRSISIEIMDMASEAWLTDGWISAHNSYLEAVYRAGFIGICMIALLFAHFFTIVRRFIIQKSSKGILLCSVLVQWFVIAFFSVTYELPYIAIPIWFMYGVTWKYSEAK